MCVYCLSIYCLHTTLSVCVCDNVNMPACLCSCVSVHPPGFIFPVCVCVFMNAVSVHLQCCLYTSVHAFATVCVCVSEMPLFGLWRFH